MATSHKYIINGNQFILQLAMLLLCVGAVRAGHETLTLNWMYLLVLLNGALFLFSRRLNLRTADLYLFVLVSALEIPLQWLVGKYYGLGSAISAFICLALTVLLVSQLVRQGYEACLWRIINAVSIFSTICLFIQTAALLIGIRLDTIPIINDLFFKAWEFATSFRPCATFSEPSHYAEIVLLSVFYYLFIDHKKKLAFALIVGLFISTSGLGIIGSALLIVFYILNLDRFSGISSSKKYLIIAFSVFAGIGALIWAQSSSWWIIQRIMSGGTSSVRILRSFDLYRIMDFWEKTFGIGNQNQALYLNYHQIVLPHDTSETLASREFAQTLGYVMCTTGLIGFGAFLFPFVKMIITQDYRMKTLVLMFLFVCATCCIFARHIFAVYLVMIYATSGMIKNPLQKPSSPQ